MRRIMLIGSVVLAAMRAVPLLAQGMRGGSFDGAAMTVVTCGTARSIRGSAFDGANMAVVTCGTVRSIRGSAFDGAQMAVVTCGAPRAITGSGCNGDHMAIRVCAGEVYVTETCVTTALPVDLIELNARCEPGGVRLSWITGSETNSAYFSIERAREQQEAISMDDLDWRTVGTVAAAGQSQRLTQYAFFDEPGHMSGEFHGSGELYHRVAQVDLDGSTNYFPMTATTYPCDGSQFISVHPVPVHQMLHVRSSMPLDAIVISDALGHAVLTFASGQDLSTLDVTRLSPGAYSLAGHHGAGVSYARFVVEH